MLKYIGLAVLGLMVTVDLLLFAVSLHNNHHSDTLRYGLKSAFWAVVLIAATIDTCRQRVENADDDADHDGP